MSKWTLTLQVTVMQDAVSSQSQLTTRPTMCHLSSFSPAAWWGVGPLPLGVTLPWGAGYPPLPGEGPQAAPPGARSSEPQQGTRPMISKKKNTFINCLMGLIV